MLLSSLLAPMLCCCVGALLRCRVATTGLLALLCCTYPALHGVFIALIALDIFSHWFQMYASLLAGSSTHKVRHQEAPRQLLDSTLAAATAAAVACSVVSQGLVE
jgi:hypothetical protein